MLSGTSEKFTARSYYYDDEKANGKQEHMLQHHNAGLFV